MLIRVLRKRTIGETTYQPEHRDKRGFQHPGVCEVSEEIGATLIGEGAAMLLEEQPAAKPGRRAKVEADKTEPVEPAPEVPAGGKRRKAAENEGE